MADDMLVNLFTVGGGITGSGLAAAVAVRMSISQLKSDVQTLTAALGSLKASVDKHDDEDSEHHSDTRVEIAQLKTALQIYRELNQRLEDKLESQNAQLALVSREAGAAHRRLDFTEKGTPNVR